MLEVVAGVVFQHFIHRIDDRATHLLIFFGLDEDEGGADQVRIGFFGFGRPHALNLDIGADHDRAGGQLAVGIVVLGALL